MVAVLANVHGPRSPRKRTPLDLPGQAAAIVAIGALTFGVIEAGHEGLDSTPALAAFAVFAVAAAAFVAIERSLAHPAVPLDLFRTPMVATTVVGGLLLNFAFYGQVFVLSLFFQQVLGHNALVSGLMFLPLTALIAAVNIVSGRLTSRHGPRPPLIAGQAIMIAGLLAMLAFDADSATALILVLLVPMGVGGGLAVPPLTAALLEALPPERAGLASGRLQRRPPVRRRARGGAVRRPDRHPLRRRDARRAGGRGGGVAVALVLTLAYVHPAPAGEAAPVRA